MTQVELAVRLCSAGHELPKSSGQCIECRRNLDRRRRAAKTAMDRAARGLDPHRMCGRGMHRMVGENIAVEKRTRIDGTPYEIERCYACSTRSKSRAERGPKEVSKASSRLAASARIAEIHAEILAMCDVLEISSGVELERMRARRAELTREHDRLAR
jgi:hypothetical protein